MAELLPHHRNLPVPFLSQRKNTYVFKGKYRDGKTYDTTVDEDEYNNDIYLDYVSDEEINDNEIDDADIKEVSMSNRSCNITCIAMILHYFGITTDTPDTMMKYYFENDHFDADEKHDITDKSVMAFQWWAVMEEFVQKTYGTKCTPELYTATSTIENLENDIAAGYPVMMSIGSVTVDSSNGHIVVVRGFTKIGGIEYIILNDPWGHVTELDKASGVRAYDNTGDDGDNVVLKIDDFKKMIDGIKITSAMVIYAPLWQYPDGTEIATTTNEPAIINGGSFAISGGAWHNGIHLKSEEIRSIGTGRLLAVRNKDALNGSASFMLVQHQCAKIKGSAGALKLGDLLTFNALYMHTTYIDIKVCATEYFTTGKLPARYNFKWLLQLFSSMLPHVRVLKNTNPTATETYGLMNADYKKLTIHRARIIEDDGLGRTIDDDGNMIPASEEFHGRRMLVHVLPVTSLFQKLLDPKNYSDPVFQQQMLDPSNFVKEVKIDGIDTPHVFFHSYDASTDAGESGIFCSNTGLFEDESITVNGKTFKRTAEKLSKLYKKEVVSFDDLVNLPVPSSFSVDTPRLAHFSRGLSDYASLFSSFFPKDAASLYLNSKAQSLTFINAPRVTNFASLSEKTFLGAQRNHWKKIFGYRKTGNPSTFVRADNFFTGLEDISLDLVLSYADNKDTEKNVYTKLKTYFESEKTYSEGDKTYFKGYKKARYGELEAVLTELSNKNANSKVSLNQTTFTWGNHLRRTLNDCFSLIVGKTELLFDVTEETGLGAPIANIFINSLEKLGLPLGYTEIAIEMACCRLFNIPKEKITGGLYFELGDQSIQALLGSYSALLTATFNSFNMNYQHYVDTVIEISKNDIIGKCGVYNDKKMIHFDIFSAKGKNIYEKLGTEGTSSLTLADSNSTSFFMPSLFLEKLKDPIESVIGPTFEVRGCHILRPDESTVIGESDILLKYAVQQTSEWSPKLDYTYFNNENEGDTNSHYVYAMEQTDEKGKIQPSYNDTLDTKEYFEKCMVPYYWRLDSKNWKADFPGDVCTFYHPFYFLQQININDKKSLDLHEPKDETTES